MKSLFTAFVHRLRASRSDRPSAPRSVRLRTARPGGLRPHLVPANGILWAAIGLALGGLILAAGAAFAQGGPAPPAPPPSDYRSLFGLNPRVTVWVVAELQLMFAAFLLGVPIFAVIAEVVGWRSGDEKYDKLAKEFTSLLPITSSITALLGALLTFILLYSYPRVMDNLAGTFGPTMAIFGVLFFAEVITLYVYYYGWERMKKRKGWHILLGVLLNVVGTLLMTIPNAWATFMMSPAREADLPKLVDPITHMWTGTVWQAVNNPLWMPLNIHRFVGNVMFGGFVVGAYAAIRFLAARDAASRAYYDWMGYVGNFVGMVALIPLPFAGYYLGREIYSYSSVMGNNMMGGAFSWPFIIQGLMVGMIFILANFYLWSGMGRIVGSERYTSFIKYINAGLIVCFAIWLTPHNLPLSGQEQSILGGSYHPVLKYFGLMAGKNAAINFIIISTFVTFLLYRRANKKDAVPFTSLGTGAKLGVLIPAGLVLTALALFAKHLIGIDPVALQGMDPKTVQPAAVTQWLGLIRPPIYLVVGMMIAVVVAVVLTFMNKGKLAQVMYVLAGALCSVFILGPFGFVVMTNLSPFLRDIAVTQWLIVMTVLVLVTAIDIQLWGKAASMGKVEWGKMTPRSQYSLIGLAVTAVMTMGWMGVIRSGLREDWHIFGVLRDTSPWSATPAIDYMMVVVACIVATFLIMVAFVFWLSGLARGTGDSIGDAVKTLLPDAAAERR